MIKVPLPERKDTEEALITVIFELVKMHEIDETAFAYQLALYIDLYKDILKDVMMRIQDGKELCALSAVEMAKFIHGMELYHHYINRGKLGLTNDQ